MLYIEFGMTWVRLSRMKWMKWQAAHEKIGYSQKETGNRNSDFLGSILRAGDISKTPHISFKWAKVGTIPGVAYKAYIFSSLLLNRLPQSNVLDFFQPAALSTGFWHMTYLVISGGTGGNSICSAFDDACYVLPVSDDGGSSSEIIRVLGGPSMGCQLLTIIIVSSSYNVKGDIRSRLIRLIPPAPANSPQDAIRRLLAYRFPANTSPREARDHWRDVVEGKSSLWKGIPTDRTETIRGISFSFHPSFRSVSYLATPRLSCLLWERTVETRS